MQKPLNIEITSSDDKMFMNIKFEGLENEKPTRIYHEDDVMFMRFPTLKIIEKENKTFYLLPEVKIRIADFSKATKVIEALIPFCEAVKGLELFGIEEKVINSYPDIPIMKFKEKSE